MDCIRNLQLYQISPNFWYSAPTFDTSALAFGTVHEHVRAFWYSACLSDTTSAYLVQLILNRYTIIKAVIRGLRWRNGNGGGFFFIWNSKFGTDNTFLIQNTPNLVQIIHFWYRTHQIWYFLKKLVQIIHFWYRTNQIWYRSYIFDTEHTFLIQNTPNLSFLVWPKKI